MTAGGRAGGGKRGCVRVLLALVAVKAILTMAPAAQAFVLPAPHCPVASRLPIIPSARTVCEGVLPSSPLSSSSSRSRRRLGPLGAGSLLLKEPDEMYASAVELGVEKAHKSVLTTFILAIQAGLQVGIGAAMAVYTMAGLPGLAATNPAAAKLLYGVVGLPCGLLMTAATGTMLFTGNTALAGVAFMERKITARQLAKNWFWSYLGNLLGASLLAWVCTYARVFQTAAPTIAHVAAVKASLPWGIAFARGILCNWLVTTAVWIAQGCQDLASKSAIILLVITIFASLGFEHSVANMFVGPFAALNGGPAHATFFVRNLVPVTLGNIFAGFFVVAGTYFLTYGSFAKKGKKGGTH